MTDAATTVTSRNTMWVWHPTIPTQSLVALAAHYSVGRLLMWVSPGFTQNAALGSYLDDLAKVAALKGIALDALCGDPSWAVNPGASGAWATEVRRSGRFERLHLDVEAHALPTWASDQVKLASGFVASIEAATVAGLPVDIDIPTWYNTVPTVDGQTADRAAISVASSVTVMAYRHSAADIVASSASALTASADLGKPIYIGVNVANPTMDTPDTSLWGQTPAAIRNCIYQVGQLSTPNFAGVAIHDAESLAQL